MKEQNDAILTLTPISKSYHDSLLDFLGRDDIQFDDFEFATLRRLPLRKLIQALRSIRSVNLYLVYETEAAKSLVPILGLIAVITHAKNIWIVDNNLAKKKYRRVNLILSVIQLVKGTIISHIDLMLCKYEMRRLLRAERIPFELKNQKEVLYIKTNLWFGVQVGGSIGHISGVINALVKKLYSVTYVSMEPPVMLDNNVNVKLIPNLSNYGIPQEINLYGFQRHVNKFLKYQKTFKGKNFSFIYSRMAISNYANVLASRRLKIPLILEYNGSEVWVSEKWGGGLRYKKSAQMAEDVCLKHAHLIVFVSQVLKDELISRGIDKSRILFYPNCIDPVHFNPFKFTNNQIETLRKEYGLTAKHKILTFVGTFGQWHGAEKLAEAIKELCVNYKEWLIRNNVHFMLVGNGLKMKEVKDLVDNIICKPFVTLTGLIPQNEAPLYLTMSDILISPHVANSDVSKFFGSPTKLFEYMAMAKGIIASDLDQIGVVLKNSIRINNLPINEPMRDDTRLALLVKPGDIGDLIKAIQFAVTNESWMSLLGSNASREANEKYTWDIHVSEILKTLERVTLE